MCSVYSVFVCLCYFSHWPSGCWLTTLIRNYYYYYYYYYDHYNNTTVGKQIWRNFWQSTYHTIKVTKTATFTVYTWLRIYSTEQCSNSIIGVLYGNVSRLCVKDARTHDKHSLNRQTTFITAHLSILPCIPSCSPVPVEFPLLYHQNNILQYFTNRVPFPAPTRTHKITYSATKREDHAMRLLVREICLSTLDKVANRARGALSLSARYWLFSTHQTCRLSLNSYSL